MRLETFVAGPFKCLPVHPFEEINAKIRPSLRLSQQDLVMEDILDQHFSFPEPIELNEHRDVDRPGLKCELRTYEARYNAKGERIALHVGSRRELNIPRGRDHDSALVLTRFYDKARELERTELEVQSPYIKAAMRHVIKKYPSINMDGKDLVIADLPKCLFHYRIELQSYRETINDQTAAEHVDFALRYMEQVLQNQIWNWFNFVDPYPFGIGEKDQANLDVGLEFPDLWMAFRPGSLVYVKNDGTEKILRLKDMTRCTCIKPHCLRKKWTIVGEQIIFDGDVFGYEDLYFYIYPYEGHIPFKNLRIFPLQYHPDKDHLMHEMKERGRKYVSLRDAVHQDYDGVAKCLSMFRMNSFVGEEDFFPLQSTMVS
jgi:hypothetical protein